MQGLARVTCTRHIFTRGKTHRPVELEHVDGGREGADIANVCSGVEICPRVKLVLLSGARRI